MGKIVFLYLMEPVKVNIDGNSKPSTITHLDDLPINLPCADLSPSPKAS